MIDKGYWRPREDVEALVSENRLAVQGYPDTPTRPSGSDTTATKQPRPTGQPKTPTTVIRVAAGSPVSIYQEWKNPRQRPMANVINQVTGPGAVVGKSVMPPFGTGSAEEGPSDDRRTSDDLGSAEMADAQ